MTDIGTVSADAKAWLEEIEPKHWSRHAFDPNIKCDHVANNMTEAFNNLLGDYRVRTYLSLLEYIRRLVMTRFQQRKEDCQRWKTEFPPSVNKKIVQASLDSRILTMIHAGEGEYEMLGLTRAYTTKLQDASCECGQWQINGVPCSHALAGIRHFYGMGVANERLIDFVHPSLSKSAFVATYCSMIHPIPNICAWVDIEVAHVDPPPLIKKPGRPKLLRKRESSEKPKAARRGSVICAKCKQPGHNKRTCKAVNTFDSNKVAKGSNSSSQPTQKTASSSQSGHNKRNCKLVPTSINTKKVAKGGVFSSQPANRTVSYAQLEHETTSSSQPAHGGAFSSQPPTQDLVELIIMLSCGK
ncbi:hypothetical protein Ddye_011193 [Dipteronia dyeriana]|uniref:SWIM-type domain-containing protein n=1 Tax=Dipteronia dyeriana TaxID=168575 RepID=A0AAD9XER0_9ROSI|nr:hypothetical protein Ddye_011193 [Dipteronia dyeriana]